MHTNHFKAILKSTVRVLAILSFATAAYGQQQVNLTAAPTTASMPDGTVVPMWGYVCGTSSNVDSSATATASVDLSADSTLGQVTGLTVVLGGLGYPSAPLVTISGGGTPTTTATATATINANGVVTGFTITNPGAGYTSAPTVTIAANLIASVSAATCAPLNPAAAASPCATARIPQAAVLRRANRPARRSAPGNWRLPSSAPRG